MGRDRPWIDVDIAILDGLSIDDFKSETARIKIHQACESYVTKNPLAEGMSPNQKKNIAFEVFLDVMSTIAMEPVVTKEIVVNHLKCAAEYQFQKHQVINKKYGSAFYDETSNWRLVSVDALDQANNLAADMPPLSYVMDWKRAESFLMLAKCIESHLTKSIKALDLVDRHALVESFEMADEVLALNMSERVPFEALLEMRDTLLLRLVRAMDSLSREELNKKKYLTGAIALLQSSQSFQLFGLLSRLYYFGKIFRYIKDTAGHVRKLRATIESMNSNRADTINRIKQILEP